MYEIGCRKAVDVHDMAPRGWEDHRSVIVSVDVRSPESAVDGRQLSTLTLTAGGHFIWAGFLKFLRR